MTSTLIYANRGRKLIWIGAAANLYFELTDDEEFDMQEAHETGIALGLFGSATVALFIPDPEATLLGLIGTKAFNAAKSGASIVLSRANSGFGYASQWWWTRTIAQKSAILYVAFTPLLLAGVQNEKARTGVEGWDEALGEAMWEAQAVPNTERLQIRVSTFGGGLPL